MAISNDDLVSGKPKGFLIVFLIIYFLLVLFLAIRGVPVFLVLARTVILNFEEPLKKKWITDNSNSIFH